MHLSDPTFFASQSESLWILLDSKKKNNWIKISFAWQICTDIYIYIKKPPYGPAAGSHASHGPGSIPGQGASPIPEPG